MIRQTNNGASISQYAIIIALVALALVPMFLFFGKLITENFSNFNKTFQARELALSSDQSINTSIRDGNAKAGDFGGTPENPKLICFQSKCSIDYGKFVLNDLPENFGDHVQASGNSGGTDTIAALLKQLADYLESEGDIPQATAVTKLANLSHNIAAIERHFEGKIKACNSDDTCLRGLENTAVGNITGYDSSLYSFNPNMTYRDLTMNLGLGQAYEHLYGQDKNNVDIVSREAVLTFQQIKENAEFDSEVKGIVQELYWDIGVMSERVSNLGYQMVTDHQDGAPHNTFDPLSGKKTNPTYPDGYLNFINSNAPEITDFDAALICASGNGTDNNKKCH